MRLSKTSQIYLRQFIKLAFNCLILNVNYYHLEKILVYSADLNLSDSERNKTCFKVFDRLLNKGVKFAAKSNTD
jgi:hypothetical protein